MPKHRQHYTRCSGCCTSFIIIICVGNKAARYTKTTHFNSYYGWLGFELGKACGTIADSFNWVLWVEGKSFIQFIVENCAFIRDLLHFIYFILVVVNRSKNAASPQTQPKFKEFIFNYLQKMKLRAKLPIAGRYQ